MGPLRSCTYKYEDLLRARRSRFYVCVFFALECLRAETHCLSTLPLLVAVKFVVSDMVVVYDGLPRYVVLRWVPGADDTIDVPASHQCALSFCC